MERKVYNQLLSWKRDPQHKPLILNGARQVGKTYLLRQFGEREYANVAYINCDNNQEMQRMFTAGYDMERIIRNLSALTGIDIRPHETLIILDEIQSIPLGLPSLKYFCEDASEYDVAVAGSLLGLQLHEGESFPVGKVNMIRLYPMSFSEFLEAKGEQKKLDLLRQADYASVLALEEKYIDLLRQYYFTGGMPAAVLAYVNGKSLQEVRTIQKEIIYDFSHDFSKHAPSQEVQRIAMVWESIPSQLAKDNKKFIYGAMKKGARAKEFEIAIQWLIEAGLAYKINRVSKPVMPLKFYEDLSAFKLFMLDVGLMGAMTDAPASKILIGEDIFKEYKGAFSELYVLTQLLSVASFPIHYYSTDDSRTEVDFVIQCAEDVFPLEVKAEENLRSKSLRQLYNDYGMPHALRCSMSPWRKQDWMTNIPLYAIETEIERMQQIT